MTTAAKKVWGRRSGRSTILIQAAKAHDATLVCANQQQAEHLRHEHGIDTTSMMRVLDGELFRGASIPFLWDHYAIECMVDRHQRDRQMIARLKADYEKIAGKPWRDE